MSNVYPVGQPHPTLDGIEPVYVSGETREGSSLLQLSSSPPHPDLEGRWGRRRRKATSGSVCTLKRIMIAVIITLVYDNTNMVKKNAFFTFSALKYMYVYMCALRNLILGCSRSRGYLVDVV